jgi:hypothetical protein
LAENKEINNNLKAENNENQKFFFSFLSVEELFFIRQLGPFKIQRKLNEQKKLKEKQYNLNIYLNIF